MDTAFFILSKLIGLALQVETWLVVGMVVTLAAGRFARPRFARWSGRVTLAALLAVGIFPIGDILLHPLEAEFPPRPPQHKLTASLSSVDSKTNGRPPPGATHSWMKRPNG